MNFIPTAFRLRPLSLAVMTALLPGAVLAAPVNWVPDADGFWDVVANWSSNPVLPTAADDVTLNVGGATVRTITHRNGTNTINSLTSQENFSLTGGTLTLNGASTVNGVFAMSAGVLAGAGTLTVTGAATITGGQMTGTGTTTLQGPTSISVSGLGLDAGRILRNEATLTWTAGTIDLNNSQNGGSGRIDNIAGALFDAQGNNLISATGFADVNSVVGFPAFNNAGTLRKSASGGVTNISVALNNTGTVEVQTGTLNLSGGGTSSGDFTGAPGATLQFGGGTHNLDANADITTANTTFSGGTVNHAGVYNTSGTTTVTGGTANLTGGTLTSLGTVLTITNGTLNLSGSPASVGTYTQGSGILAGTGTLTVTGAATITGGQMTGTGTTTLQGPTSISVSGLGLDAGRILRNEATLTWTAGTIDLNNSQNGGSGRIDNIAGALFDAQGNNLISATGFADVNSVVGFPAFNNAGTLRKSASGGVTNISVALNNTGTVEVQTGTLNLSGGGTSSGDFTGAPGATLQFGGGTHNLDANADITTANTTFSGGTVNHAGVYNTSGTTTVTGGTTNLTGTLTSLGTTLNITNGTLNLSGSPASVGTYTQGSGILAGTGTLTVTGAATITGGQMTGTGTTTLQGPTSISVSGLGLDAGRILRNEATLTWTAGTIDLNNSQNGGSGRIDNIAGALFDAQGNNLISATGFADVNSVVGFPAFNNAGTLRKSASGGVTNISVALNNTGTVEVQTGTLNLSGGGTSSGDFTGAPGATLQFGGGTHNLDANADITTANTTFSGGTVNHAGVYNTSGTTTVTGGTANLTGGTLTSLGTVLTITNGTLNLSGSPASVGTYTQGSGILAGTGTLTVTGAATITGGQMTGTGTTTLQGPTSISVSGLGLDAGRILRNEAVLTWTAGGIDLNNGQTGGSGRIDNIAGALFDAQGNNLISATGFADVNSVVGFPAVNNAGTFRKSSGTGTTTVQVAFNNTGAVDVQTGTLNLTNGGTSSGTFNVATDSTLQFGGGTHSLTNVSGVASTGRLLVSTGVVNTTGVLTNGGLLEITNGTLNLGGDASTARYTQSAGILSGTGLLTVTGTATLTGGQMTGGGTTILQGLSTISSSGLGLDAGRILRNDSTLTWTAGTIDLNNSQNGGSGRIDNSVGALFEAQGNNTISATGFADVNSVVGFPAVNNAGTFRKSSGTGTTTVQVAFNNTGAVDVQTGTLNLTNGGTSSGTFNVATDSTLQFGGGTHSLTNVSGVASTGRLLVSTGVVNTTGVLTNGGLLEITNGTLNLGGDASTARYTQSAGILSGTGLLTVTGTATLTGGQMTGGGTTILQGLSTISSSGLGLDAGRILRNDSTLTWTAGTIDLNNSQNGGSGRIDNSFGALFDAQGNNAISATGFADVNSLAGFPAFNNAGTFRKSAGVGVTAVQVAFNNTGLIDVQTGTVNLSAGSSHAGLDAIEVAAGATLGFAGGTHVLDGTSSNGAGRILFNTGTIDVTANDATINSRFEMTGGTRAGSGTLTVTGPATLSGGTLVGGALTVLEGGTNVNGGVTIDRGHILRNVGTLTWNGGTLDLNGLPNNGGSGSIDNALGGVFDARNSNSIIATAFGDVNTLPGFPLFNNAGTFQKSASAGATNVQVAFNNTGLVDVQIGTVSLTGNVTQHAGNVLTGGSWRVSGNGALELNESGAVNIVTNQGDVSLVGAAANFARINTLTNNQGAFRLLGARNFTAGGAFSNSGVLQLAGGAFGAPSLSNTATGEIVGFGTITPTVLNSGLVRAAGGTLTAAGGIDGQSGTLQSDADGTLVLGANSDGDFLVNNGNLVVGGFNVTVAADYTNANFGVGNAFNARANVSGAGQIVASGDVAQALTGQVTDGNSGIAQLTFGNIHVGDVVNRTFQVANTGSSGPSLRGALQTTVNGGNVTDNRLSGSGVTADNFGPLNTGTATADFTVSFAGSSAGALSNQRVAIVNNFDNVAEQVLGISGAVYRYASPSAHTPAPVVFANSRVGDVLSRALSVSNTAPADGFSEALDASIGGATAGVTSNGGAFSGLIAGATNNTSLSVGLDTTSAGAKLGTATITLASNGTGSSGLGLSSLGTQTVNVSGDVYRLASAGAHSPEPVVFANRHVGDAATQALSLTNTAANDGFSERLNASIGGATAGITSNSASFSLLGAGATNNSSLVVGIDTATAGAKLGTATITLASDGTGTSGFGALSLGTQTVNVSGDVYRLASASTMAAIQFGNVHVGDVVSQALSLTNTAANDGFSERLNASFESVSDARILASGSVTQLAAGATDGSTLAIALDTSTAGSLTGFARVRLTSDGTGTSGLGLSDLGVQNVGVTTNVAVYRYAEGLVENAVPIELGAYRVGDAAGTVGLIVSNVAANDGFSERLNASAGVTSAGFTATGNVNLLNAGASNNTSLTVGLDTTTSGTKSGTTTVDFVSDGAGTSNLGQSAAGSQSVALQGRVYAQAVATVQGSGVDFGIVHVGEVVAAQSVTVSNDAAGALNDSLLGSISSVAAGFTGSGTLGLTGLAAGASSSALSIGLDTSAAGVFNGNAALAFASHNTELADFDLGLTNVALNAQVNNFANPVLTQAGLGTFTANGANFTLDFGFVAQGTSGVTSLLQLTNLVTGPADTLGATYDFTTGPFALGGFNAFNGLVAGASQSLTVSFDAVTSGVFEQVVGIHLFGENASGFHGDLGSFQLTLRAEVAPVPVPAAVWLFGTGLLGLWGRRRAA